MCNHKNVVFIGIQKTVTSQSFKLYNCLDCSTTITGKTLKLVHKHDLPTIINTSVAASG